MSNLAQLPKHTLSHLDWLESESIYILREVAGQCANPALLFSGGKDSIVLLRLADSQGQIVRIQQRFAAGVRSQRVQSLLRIIEARTAAILGAAGENPRTARRSGAGITARSERNQPARVHWIKR